MKHEDRESQSYSMGVVSRSREVVGFKCIGWLGLLLLLTLGLALGSKAGDFLALEPNAPRHGADLLVVLGGGWNARTAAGGALMLDGWAPRVLLTGIPKTRNNNGEPLDHPRYSDLLALGVSKEQILLDGSARNTWAEAHLIRDVLDENGWRSVLIVSDPPHFRRLQWVCRRVFGGSNIDYQLIASRPNWWNPDLWWKNKTSASFVFKEFVKLLYYYVKYA